jgi:lysophospholipase L1-like esterase
VRRWLLIPSLGLAGVSLLVGEAVWTFTRDYLPADAAPRVAGVFGSGGSDRTPLRITLLGDSTAAGVGASSTRTTVGWQLAAQLSRASGRRVRLDSVAVSGARTKDLAAQVAQAAADRRPDVAVILVGANDATLLSPSSGVRRELGGAVRRLVGTGSRVIVGTCPDMGAVPAIPPPLRQLTGWRGRAIAAAETEAVRAAGGTPVDLGRLTGPAFRADPRTFSADRFHPSDRGYAIWAEALRPAVREAAASLPASSPVGASVGAGVTATQR